MFETQYKRPDNGLQYGVFPVKRRRQRVETIIGVNIRALFGGNLRRFRKNANLSQSGLAEKADLAPNFVNDIENGRKWISPESLGKLSKALGIEPYQLFISSPMWNNQGVEYLTLFLSDIEKMSKEYRERFFIEEPEKNS